MLDWRLKEQTSHLLSKYWTSSSPSVQHYRTETLWWQLFTDPRAERWVWPNYFTDSIVKRSAWKDEIHNGRQWSTTAIWLRRAPFTGKPRGLGSAPGSRTRGLETFGHRDEARKVISSPHTLTHCSKGGCKDYLCGRAKWGDMLWILLIIIVVFVLSSFSRMSVLRCFSWIPLTSVLPEASYCVYVWISIVGVLVVLLNA